MSIADTLDYITLGNPVSKMVIASASTFLRTIVITRILERITVPGNNINVNFYYRVCVRNKYRCRTLQWQCKMLLTSMSIRMDPYITLPVAITTLCDWPVSAARRLSLWAHTVNIS